MDRLTKRLEELQSAWLPGIGECFPITFTPAERTILLARLGQGWVPASERLPDNLWADPPSEWTADISGVVNILTGNNSVGSAAYHRAKGVWFTGGLTKECGYRELVVEVVAWQPLPPAPGASDG